ncbi:acetolactate decarboxylase [Neisseriaceae bacterium TC5R-5]|nr:acetolactate decarboxylase [Neisseriaceae bacterium TC5R-5]
MTPSLASNHDINIQLSDSVWTALQQYCAHTGGNLNHTIETLLARSLELEQHTIFQVSTAGALVEGVFQGCVKVADIKRHGDFGLGTFDGLDGEGVLLNGELWQVASDGQVNKVADDTLSPFWVSTFFCADAQHTLTEALNMATLAKRLDAWRSSANLFVALRISGQFDWIKTRAACKAQPGEGLLAATSHQAEFEFTALRGTLVGFWTPDFARTINVPGYHLHFLSDDRQHGGHLLEFSATQLAVELHTESNLYLTLPETAAFMLADLSHDPSADLSQAEKNHS